MWSISNNGRGFAVPYARLCRLNIVAPTAPLTVAVRSVAMSGHGGRQSFSAGTLTWLSQNIEMMDAAREVENCLIRDCIALPNH
jgi:hypothetical protein